MTEDEVSMSNRQRAIEALRLHRPDLDADKVISGVLAGPATEDRPPFPAWEYDQHRADPEWSNVGDLANIRFPILSTTGDTLIMSLSEFMEPPSTAATGGELTNSQVGFQDAVRLFQIMHSSGALRWESSRRMHIEILPQEEYLPKAFRAWREYMDR